MYNYFETATKIAVLTGVAFGLAMYFILDTDKPTALFLGAFYGIFMGIFGPLFNIQAPLDY